MTTNCLRNTFLEFFKNKGHKIFPSDSLLPVDRSVLFTSAGMNQFKPYFLGEKKDVKRAASVQKCLRTQDLEEVGKTPYHHTFFEMLGNFSFGDYFKEEAIAFAWEFLTSSLNLPQEKLWVSVYKDDKEAYKIWKERIGLPEEKIVLLDEETNFWPANVVKNGPSGPCGPCSEVFFDRGENKGCGRKTCSPACDCFRFVEIWNLVFTQFNRTEEGKLLPLPQKNIDTGMGLERMASVLQNKETNFDIDIIIPLKKEVIKILKIDNVKENESYINSIVDFSRAATFAISDGAYPSNEERGYVVRKLIRQALWRGSELGRKKPFVYLLVPLLSDLMGKVYPEVDENKDKISSTIKYEEEKFLHTLILGKKKFSEILGSLKKEDKNYFPSRQAFYLYDTYGLPLSLIEKLAEEKGFLVNSQEVQALLDKQKKLSRSKSAFAEEIFSQKSILTSCKTEFCGYENLEVEALVCEIFFNNATCDCLDEGKEGVIILDKTSFYPEAGGQLCDKGLIKGAAGEFKVEEVFSTGEAIVHRGKVLRGRISLQDKVKAVVDKTRRQKLMRAHTATHLLQAVLREILGTIVTQQGSLVDEDRLRFDFSYPRGLNAEEIDTVEKRINSYILRGDRVKKKTLSYEEAKKEGALAFFTEKYKDQVRVVEISSYSKELCGGTHLENTSEVGSFVIISEAAVASGIRRIEALVGERAYQFFKDNLKTTKDIASFLKVPPPELASAVLRLSRQLHSSKEEIENLKRQVLSLKIDEIMNNTSSIEGVDFIFYSFKNEVSSSLLFVADLIKIRRDKYFLFLSSHNPDKTIFLCSQKGLNLSAKEFISKFGKRLNLKGGGKDNLVQGVILSQKDNFSQQIKEVFREFILTSG